MNRRTKILIVICGVIWMAGIYQCGRNHGIRESLEMFRASH